MRRVGRLYGFVNEEGRVEWRRLTAKNPNDLKNPFRFSAILAVTNAGENPPERYPAIDESIVCRKCEGSGYFPAIPSYCPKCSGTGRRAMLPIQRPQIRPSSSWNASPMSLLFPHFGR
jgi:hypothetical protein